MNSTLFYGRKSYEYIKVGVHFRNKHIWSMSLGWGVSLGLSVPLGMGVGFWAGFWDPWLFCVVCGVLLGEARLLLRFGFWRWGGWVLGYASTEIWDFLNISLSPKIVILKPLGNSWDHFHTKFAILDITFRFTCG